MNSFILLHSPDNCMGMSSKSAVLLTAYRKWGNNNPLLYIYTHNVMAVLKIPYTLLYIYTQLCPPPRLTVWSVKLHCYGWQETWLMNYSYVYWSEEPDVQQVLYTTKPQSQLWVQMSPVVLILFNSMVVTGLPGNQCNAVYSMFT